MKVCLKNAKACANAEIRKCELSNGGVGVRLQRRAFDEGSALLLKAEWRGLKVQYRFWINQLKCLCLKQIRSMFNFKMEPATWESLKTIDQKLTEIHQILNTLNVAFFPYHILHQI